MVAIKSFAVLALASVAAAATTGTSAAVTTDAATETVVETVVATATAAATETVTDTATEVVTETSTEATTAAAECQTLAELLIGNPDFSILLGAVQSLNLADRFNATSIGNVTVFAPNDAAFTGVNLTALTPEELKGIISYHVVPGVVTSDLAFDGAVLDTYNLGNELTVSVSAPDANGQSTIKINNATVTTADVPACNGVVHIIDGVLLPSEPAATETATTEVAATEAPTETGTATETATETAIEEATETPTDDATETSEETSTTTA